MRQVFAFDCKRISVPKGELANPDQILGYSVAFPFSLIPVSSSLKELDSHSLLTVITLREGKLRIPNLREENKKLLH